MMVPNRSPWSTDWAPLLYLHLVIPYRAACQREKTSNGAELTRWSSARSLIWKAFLLESNGGTSPKTTVGTHVFSGSHRNLTMRHGVGYGVFSGAPSLSNPAPLPFSVRLRLDSIEMRHGSSLSVTPPLSLHFGSPTLPIRLSSFQCYRIGGLRKTFVFRILGNKLCWSSKDCRRDFRNSVLRFPSR